MSTTVRWLAGLLTAQVALAALLLTTGGDTGAFKASEPLAAFNDSAVASIAIASEDGDVTLNRAEGGWVIPALGDFPANGAKVEKLLEKLADLKRGYPVSRSRANAARYAVDDDSFERKVALSNSDSGDVATFFFGESPSFKRIYARAGGEADVYNVPFAAFDAQAAPGDWVDREALYVPREDIRSVTLNGLTIRNVDGEFLIAGLDEDEAPVAGKVHDLVGALARFGFDDVVPASDAPDLSAAPAVAVQVSFEEGAREYQFFEEPSDDDAPKKYLIKSSDHSQVFRTSPFRADSFIEATRAALVKDTSAPSPTEGAAETTDSATPSPEATIPDDVSEPAIDADGS